MSQDMLEDNAYINEQYSGTVAEDATHRIVIYPTVLQDVWPTKIFVKLSCESGGGTSYIDKVYFGRSALETGGNAYDFADAGTITEITFGGASGVTLADEDEVSDTIDFEVHPTQTHVLSIHTTSASGNKVHYDSTAWTDKYVTYTREGGDYAADVALGTPTTSYPGEIFFLEELHENEDWTLDAELIELVTADSESQGVVGSLNLPALEVLIAINTQVWTEVPLSMPCLSLVASFGDRLGLDENLFELRCAATAAARCNEDATLPSIQCAATLFGGATASLIEPLGFPTLSIFSGTGVASDFPVLSLDIELSAPLLGILDADIPFFSLSAEGGREGVGDVDAVLFVPELIASSGAKQGHLSAEVSNLQISATGGLVSSVDALLSLMTVTATGHGRDTGLDLPLFVPDITATGYGRDIGLERILFVLDIAATGYGMDKGLDLPLFVLDISATGTNRQTTLERDLFILELVAVASGMQSALACNLPWMRATATITSGFGAALEGWVPVPELTATLLETPLMTLDTDLSAFFMGANDTGAVLQDVTAWTATVLRHSRW